MTFKKKIKIAVLLATYNGEKFIEEQVNSILKNKPFEINLFVADDLSYDNTSNILKKIQKAYPKQIFIHINKERYGSCRNFLNLLINLNLSKYDYVALSDQDDLWQENKLSRAVEILKKNYDCFSSSFTSWWHLKNKYKKIKKSYQFTRRDFIFESPGPGNTFVLKKNFVKDLKSYLMKNKFDNRIKHHDWFIYFFARIKKYNWFIDNQSNILYRQHENNEIGVNYGFSGLKKRIKNINNGYWFNQSYYLCNYFRIKKSFFDKNLLINKSTNYLKLSLYFFNARRRLRDKFVFLLVCYFLFFKRLIR